MAGYVYRGTVPWVPGAEPAGPEPRPAGRRAVAPFVCGTLRAYNQHLKLKEETCQPCRDAAAANRRTRKTRPRVVKTIPACGTPAAYSRHRYYNETPCDPCRDANAERSRINYEKQKVAA